MPFLLAWLLVPAAFASWCVAGFVLLWREHGRLLATVLVPAVAVGFYLYADYWGKRVAPAEPGWDVFFALVCLFTGAFTVMATLPVYWIAERTLGGRAA